MFNHLNNKLLPKQQNLIYISYKTHHLPFINIYLQNKYQMKYKNHLTISMIINNKLHYTMCIQFYIKYTCQLMNPFALNNFQQFLYEHLVIHQNYNLQFHLYSLIHFYNIIPQPSKMKYYNPNILQKLYPYGNNYILNYNHQMNLKSKIKLHHINYNLYHRVFNNYFKYQIQQHNQLH